MSDIIAFLKDHWILTVLGIVMLWSRYRMKVQAAAMENIPGSLVKKIESDAEWKDMVKQADGKIILVDFYATWCGPCVRAAPIFAKISQESAKLNIELWKVDVDGPHTISKRESVSCMPTFKFYRVSNGSMVELETIQGWAEQTVRTSIAKYTVSSKIKEEK